MISLMTFIGCVYCFRVKFQLVENVYDSFLNFQFVIGEFSFLLRERYTIYPDFLCIYKAIKTLNHFLKFMIG